MKKGFTLVELLVVLIVIGILIALILPNTLAAIRQANNKECASNLRTIDTALMMCYTATHDWTKCAKMAALVGTLTAPADYLASTPVCPFGKAYAFDTTTAKDGSVTSVKTDHFKPWPPAGEHQP